ncbi:MAG: ABC transporter ATP-binding protein [Bacteroidales bacterium]|nr:ABC transporter ATP-binding protein [Bacteroidales bacterium]MDD2687788.1 ABC transporter ATP-binding protein [Bacteroidales bacterium]MDD3329985.1 ABC transporter ATP-binding protein [Bacteroidales bacterium]MDD3690666.1 ABC transporter ATP-binding protein [Bacteroidales bacterium]MDD4043834.1 ABC transporter ATP-binding protein [Bacteroidales bacterium]
MLEYSIQVNNLTKKFGDFTSVNNISFDVKKGEIFGLLGANGAGKTTTIRMLCGLLIPTSGTMNVAGFDVFTQGKEIRKHIGYMSQRFSLYEDLSVIENLELFGTIYKLKRDILRKRILQIIARLQMRKYAGSKVEALPLGQKQKLAFATALIHKPEVVFLDEPTSGVDPLVRRDFWNMIYESASEGVTIVVTTHYMDEAEYCNRLCFMNNGKVEIVGNPTDLKIKYQVDNMNDVFHKISHA